MRTDPARETTHPRRVPQYTISPYTIPDNGGFGLVNNQYPGQYRDLMSGLSEKVPGTTYDRYECAEIYHKAVEVSGIGSLKKAMELDYNNNPSGYLGKPTSNLFYGRTLNIENWHKHQGTWTSGSVDIQEGDVAILDFYKDFNAKEPDRHTMVVLEVKNGKITKGLMRNPYARTLSERVEVVNFQEWEKIAYNPSYPDKKNYKGIRGYGRINQQLPGSSQIVAMN